MRSGKTNTNSKSKSKSKSKNKKRKKRKGRRKKVEVPRIGLGVEKEKSTRTTGRKMLEMHPSRSGDTTSGVGRGDSTASLGASSGAGGGGRIRVPPVVFSDRELVAVNSVWVQMCRSFGTLGDMGDAFDAFLAEDGARTNRSEGVPTHHLAQVREGEGEGEGEGEREGEEHRGGLEGLAGQCPPGHGYTFVTVVDAAVQSAARLGILAPELGMIGAAHAAVGLDPEAELTAMGLTGGSAPSLSSMGRRRVGGQARKIGASNLAQLSMGPPVSSSSQRLGGPPRPMAPSLDHSADIPRSGASGTNGGLHDWVMVRYIDAFVVFVQRSMSHLLFTSVHQKALYKLLASVLRFMFPATGALVSSSPRNSSVRSFQNSAILSSTTANMSPSYHHPSSLHASRTSSRENMLSEVVESRNSKHPDTSSIHTSALFHSESVPAGLVP